MPDARQQRPLFFAYQAELAIGADQALASDPTALSAEALEMIHKVNAIWVLRCGGPPVREPSYTQYVGSQGGKRSWR